jgi:catechol 2,3-dioxygenase-like lactoylglutathione lyase family enzyme
MLKSAPLIAFVATTDAARATRFYAEVLGLTFVADEPHAVVFDAAGTMLRIQKAEAVTPHPYTALGWRVDDITGTVARLASLGVRFERYPFLTQDDAGIWTTPDRTRVAWFRDPDGNLLSLTEWRTQKSDSSSAEWGKPTAAPASTRGWTSSANSGSLRKMERGATPAWR